MGILEIKLPEGFSLEKQQIQKDDNDSDNDKVVFCLLNQGKIVYVSWGEINQQKIKEVISQIEKSKSSLKATK
jgi:predicted transcriptional regulator